MPTTATHPTDALQEFDVDVCRTAYGFATLKISAPNEYEAQQLALDQAGDHLFNEKHSEYELSHPVLDIERNLVLVFEMESTHPSGSSSIASAVLNVTSRWLARVESLSKLVSLHDLTELRIAQLVDDWTGYGEATQKVEAGATDVEIVVGRKWVSLEGLDVDIDMPVSSMGLDIDTLKQAFDSGSSHLYVALRMGDPFEALDPVQENHPIPDIDRLMIVKPDGLMSQDEVRQAHARRNDHVEVPRN